MDYRLSKIIYIVRTLNEEMKEQKFLLAMDTLFRQATQIENK